MLQVMCQWLCFQSAIIANMILVTGGTGFIGNRLVNKLIQSGESVRILIRPNRRTPRLPKKIALNIAVGNLDDERGMRSALRDVTTVIHLATAEQQNSDSALDQVDVQGTICLMDAAKDAGVRQILFLGRIGADKSSSFPVLRAKALAEDTIRKRGIPYCVLRLTDIFGIGDHFTTEIAAGLRRAPILYPLPGEGQTLLQPLWIEDLISVMLLIQEKKRYQNEIFEIGGNEFYPFKDVVLKIGELIQKKNLLIPIAPAYLRLINLWFRRPDAVFPISTHWLDLLAKDRTCPLDSLTRNFSLMPARFLNHLEYLKNEIRPHHKR